MADEYDADLVQQLLEEALNQMRIKQKKFGSIISSLIHDLHDLVQDEIGGGGGGGSKVGSEVTSPLAASPTTTFQNASSGGGSSGKEKKVISSRACVVCGRDDRPGQQRQKGFKCNECVGLPSKLDQYSIQFEEMKSLEKRINQDGEKVVNEFVFLGHLGKGSYGKVKLAIHTKSDQKYAAKILNKQSLQKVHKAGSQQTAMDAVRTEIAILKALNHPNIIKMYALIDDPSETKLYLIMEYLEGGQLYHVNPDGTAGSPMEKERLKKHVVGIARGLQYLHQKNIVHRDIKPENILLDLHDNVKLTDFGVSTSCSEDDDVMDRTEGSPAYFPPEEFSHERVRGKAHDIWSFGVTVYAMAFGVLPFRGSSLAELGNAVMNTEPTYPIDADPHLVSLLKGMLQKDQLKRIRADHVLDHPFVADVRTVKGYPVETIKLNLQVVDGIQPAFLPQMPPDTQAIVIPITHDDDQQHELRGVHELVSFFKTEGPEFQIVRGGVYSTTLYSIKSDPRRKQLRKQLETQ